MLDLLSTAPVTTAGYFGLAVATAVVPWLNAEVLTLSALPLVGPGRGAIWTLVLAMAGGQVVGKSLLYWMSRLSAGRAWPRRWQAGVERWRSRFDARPRSAWTVTFVSALVGFPPPIAIAIVAGATRVGFAPFLTLAATGRLVHFAVVAFLPELIRRFA